jgi:LysR family transcriptional regulator, mexEF-oprN operon transcriptional activator
VLLGPLLLSYLRESAPGIRLHLESTDRLFDRLDAGRLDFGIAFGPLAEGQVHHKQGRLGADTFVCIFNDYRVGFCSPLSLEDYVRLPHVLTTLRRGEQGVVDEALAKLGRSPPSRTRRFGGASGAGELA